MNKFKIFIIIVVGLVVAFNKSSAQGFLHRDGNRIVDGEENNFIIRSIGTGNWMLQEGYMMQTAEIYGTQHEFRNKLIEEIGVEKTDSFYNEWLRNHFTRADVDSMKAWGFNAVRPALHYKWFTLPIEDEPDENTNTWLNQGFEMLDSLVAWCTDNKMYVILDMHGTPGGQGKDANISDYDAAKPSLWESQQNKEKLIALWAKLAERYAQEPYVGGYDLINETNWTFSEPNNQPLWDLFQQITTAIRQVDNNHLIFLEGNWFANDYGGFPGVWDENMALSFHKYWTYNDANSLDWMINLQNQFNVPLWLGESGENSNTWFTNLIALAEAKNIGWSWWPVKKSSINNVLHVLTNSDYEQLIKSWRGEAAALNTDETFQAVLTFAHQHNIENCVVQYDVIDAMLRQSQTTATKPFKSHPFGQKIYFTDYDYGRNNFAYFDIDTANYSGSTGTFSPWNLGWVYRNDGVDIENCTDNYATNGYSIGWTENGEWLQFTLYNETESAYDVEVRSASANDSGSVLTFEVNGEAISPNIQLPNTNGWNIWSTTNAEQLIFPQGEVKLRAKISKSGSNLNYFKFTNPQAVAAVNFKFLAAQTGVDSKKVLVTLNKSINDFDEAAVRNAFTLWVNNQQYDIAKVSFYNGSSRVLQLLLYKDLLYTDKIELSYSGSTLNSGSQVLQSFTKEQVLNNLKKHITLPAKIEAEDFDVNNGFVVQDCEDYGDGENLGYANPGDFVEYHVYVENAGTYKLDYRVATEQSGAKITTYIGVSNNLIPIDVKEIENTGGWQSWQTQSSQVNINSGVQTLRIYVNQGEFNLNWFKFSLISGEKSKKSTGFLLYPNPANNKTFLKFENAQASTRKLELISLSGEILLSSDFKNSQIEINTTPYPSGIYCLRVSDNENTETVKLLIQKSL